MFSVTDNQKLFAAHLNAIAEKELPFATAVALTRTAKAIIPAEKKAMRQKLDRPKPFTLNSMRVIPAKKTKLVATVLFKDAPTKAGAPAGQYLKPQVGGGVRKHKRFEKALIAMGLMKRTEYAQPGKRVKLNAYGNVSNAQIKKILANVQEGKTFFVPSKASKLPRGVYQRMAKRKLKLWFVFEGNEPNYAKRFPFEKVAEKVTVKAFPGIHTKELRKAVLASRHWAKLK